MKNLVKAVLVLVVSLVSLSGFGQQTFHIDSVYQDKSIDLIKRVVVEYPDMTSSQIKEGVLQWVGRTFNSAEGVIKSNTESSMTMTPILTYTQKVLGMPYSYKTKLQVHFEFKDGKMRVSFTDMVHKVWNDTYKMSVSKQMKDGFIKSKGKYREVLMNKGFTQKASYKTFVQEYTGVLNFIKGVEEINLTSEVVASDW